MPTYTFNINDFNSVLSRSKITVKDLEEKLPLMAVPVDDVDGDEISVEVMANRPDMLGVEGLSKAFEGFTGENTSLLNYEVEESEPLKVFVSKEMETIRPYIAFTKVTNISLDDIALQSSFTFHEKLHVTHARNRKKAAIGLYDYKSGHLEAPITFKLVNSDKVKYVPLGETQEMTLRETILNTPKGREYADIIPHDDIPVLMDKNEKVLAIIPILNCDESKVTEKSDEIFVDVTGTDMETVISTFNIVLTALADRGAKIHPSVVEYPYDTPLGRTVNLPDFSPKAMTVKSAYLDKHLGKQVPKKDMAKYLKRSRFGVKEIKKGTLEVKIPCYRTDILHPIDLVEEIAINYGYQKFKPTIPNVTTVGEESAWHVMRRRITNLLTGTGAYEVMTFMLTNEDKLFTKMEMPIDYSDVVQIANPMTNLTTVCRNWILPSLMEILQRNKMYNYPQKIFEFAKDTHIDTISDTNTRDDWKISYAIAGGDVNYNSSRAILSTLEINLNLRFTIKKPEKEIPFLISGRAGEIYFNNKKIGFLGEIHPKVLTNWELIVPVACLEIEVKEWLVYIRKELGLDLPS
jgi:phenylalanyl-tRNA synthetase beta chain